MVRIVRVRAHPAILGCEERRQGSEGDGLRTIDAQPPFARECDRHTFRVDACGPHDTRNAHRGGRRRLHGIPCELRCVRACGEGHRDAHVGTIRPFTALLCGDRGERRIHDAATRPGCKPDLPSPRNRRKLLPVRPTGKSEKAERPRPPQAENHPNPNLSLERTRPFGLGWDPTPRKLSESAAGDAETVTDSRFDTQSERDKIEKLPGGPALSRNAEWPI